jgi:glycosyltransferase involved in cell wall biosynthesis
VLPSKGLFDVLEALCILDPALRVRLRYAGSIIPEAGATAESIRGRLDEYHGRLGDRFIECGHLDDAEKWALLLDSDILLLPSAFPKEGQPLSIIEALYAGCFVIATEYRAIQDMIEDGKNGRFVPAGDPQAIARAIETVSNDPGLLVEAAARSRERATKLFNPHRNLRMLSDVIGEALAS